ncbi:uncharacterized protein EI90DRAFT_3156220 [Cantharellus anzutake]|uniref:uncharacterized protein n=1 Tax=Cantharellus anzutake TaxID=1750568 RepID=UPI0019056AAA|nr:uncharacterized protein EI90DRAFT_3156220 [Cantharellus anzutake]KAF8327467.1 hypothetical protein EI90DRAFT_3156220 [Cantharellus anzutake]
MSLNENQGSMHPGTPSRLPFTPQGGSVPSKTGGLGSITGEHEHHYSSVDPPGSIPSAAEVEAMVLRPHPAESSVRLPLPASSSSTSLPHSYSTSPPSDYSTSSGNLLNYLLAKSGRTVHQSHVFGVHLSTILRLAFIIFALIGIVVGWVLTIMLVEYLRKNPNTNTSNDNTAVSDSSTTQSVVFIHIAFAIIALLLLILLERTIFIARAQRYSMLHPEVVSASLGDRLGTTAASIPLAPWARPPLPTYAAAIGYRGTGDVEDEEIMGPAPPEYGNTRGSTLLLSGPASAALRMGDTGRSATSVRTVPLARSGSRTSTRAGGRNLSLGEEGEGDRTWTNERRMSNMDLLMRARRLEESLVALEHSSAGQSIADVSDAAESTTQVAAAGNTKSRMSGGSGDRSSVYENLRYPSVQAPPQAACNLRPR